MSAFTEPLARVRGYVERFDCPYRDAVDPGMHSGCEFCAEREDIIAALAQVERLATDMETTLQDFAEHGTRFDCNPAPSRELSPSTALPVEADWQEAARRAEMRWMSMEDATIELPARLVAEHSRHHEALVEIAKEARVLTTMDGQNWLPRFEALRAALSALDGDT